MITIFEDGYNITSPHYISIDTALERIKSGKSKETTLNIRSETDGSKRDKLKLSLPSVLFHGEFKTEVEKEYKSGRRKGEKYKSFREDESITKHSGFLVLDFDKCDTISKVNQLKADPYTYACWVSPSGNGVKALIRCAPDLELHYNFYDAILERYPELDTTSKSVSRLCFESYDPDIYVNKDSKVWEDVIIARKPKEIKEYVPSKRNYKAFDTAVSMVRSSYDGIKHDTLIKAAKLLSGFFAEGTVNEDEAFMVLRGEIQAKGVKDMAGAEKAILDGFEYGKSQPIYKTVNQQNLSYTQSISRIDTVDLSKFIVSAKSIDADSEEYFNSEGNKWRGLGLPQLDAYLPWRDNCFQTVTGGKGAGKTTLMLYLFAQDSWINGTRRFIRSYENDAMELQNEVIGFLCGDNAEWAYKKDRAAYNKANEFFHHHFTILKFPPDTNFFQITDYAAQLNSQGTHSQLVIDPLFKVPETDDYAKNKRIASYCEPFATDVMSLIISMHPNGSTQRAGGQPKDLDAEFGAVYSNAADITTTMARDYKDKDPSVRNTVNFAIDKVRSKKLFGGNETARDCPIKFEYRWREHSYRIWVPKLGDEDNYEFFNDVFFK